MEKAQQPTEPRRITVFIVEDSAPIRQRLVAMLRDVEGISVVGEADEPKGAVEGILRTRPDSVLLDIQLVGGSGLEVLKKVRHVAPDTAFVVLTNHPSPQYRHIFINAGASCFLDKNTEFESVGEAVRAAATAFAGPEPVRIHA
jgi:DNA-binding NarL/FixJ family response regulator